MLCFSLETCVGGDSKSRLDTAAGAGSCGQRRNQKLLAAVARSAFEVKTKKLRVSKHFLRLRCRKLATPLWREAHFELKSWGSQSTFWIPMSKKLHAAVARTTFSSQSVRGSEHFLKFRCRKIARRCSENHIFKWTCTKHVSFGPLFEVPISKKMHATVARKAFPSQNVKRLTVSKPFLKFRCQKWHATVREAHFQVKVWGARTTFWSSEVEQLVSS